MNDDDLDLAFAMERLILGGHVRLPCNCILEVLCTMPQTFWVRVIRYDHRCPRHPRGGDHLLKHEPAWVTVDGQLIGRDLFSMTFHKLVSAYGVVLVPGFITNYGRTRLPSMLSLEGTHWIIDTGQTESIPRNER